MNTLPFTYECARKGGDLDRLSYPNLVDCGNCVAKVINAQGKDVGNEKECQACYGHISKGLEGEKGAGQKHMTSLIGCCAEGIKGQIEKEKGKKKGAVEAPQQQSAPPQQQPPKQMVERVRGLPNPEEEFDEFHHEIRLPRMR